jgi:hypothetical protein
MGFIVSRMMELLRARSALAECMAAGPTELAWMHSCMDMADRAAAAGSKARVMLIASVVRSAFLLVFVDMIGDRARPHFAAPCASARDSVTAPHCAVRTTDCVSKSFHT